MKQTGSIGKRMICGIMTLLLVLTLLPGQVLAEPEQTGIVFEDDFAVIEPETAEDGPFYVAEDEEDGFFVEEALAQTRTDSGEDPEDELIFESQCGAEGSDVTFSLYKSGRLVFSGTGEIKDFSSVGDDQVPWYNFRTSITTVEVGKGITKIGTNTFSGCTKLTDVSLPPTLLSVGSSAFSGCSSLTSLDLPYGAGTLGSSVFSGCTSLCSVTLSPNLKTVSSAVFEKCSSLESISLPDQVTSISSNAFSGCSKLENIKLPSQLNSVGQSAFQNCSAFTSITLPDKLTSLGSTVFKGCSNLNTIYFSGSAPTFKSNTFDDIKATAYYKGDDSWTSDVLKDYGGKITWAYGGTCGDDITWILNGGTLTITGTGEMSFFNQPWVNLREEITALRIESGVTSIGGHAFIYCGSLKTAEIADTMTMINYNAFASCSKLSEITFKGNAPTIDSTAFSGVTATANYPGDDPTWTMDVLQDYSGTITWNPYGEKPVIITQPVDVSVVAGGTAVFSVTAIGATKYQWVCKKPSYYTWQPVSEESGTSATYSVIMTEEMNGYKFGCRVSNAMGYVESNIVELTLFSGNAIPIDASTFPDETFRDYISEKADTNHDGYLTDAERSAVEKINLSGKETVTSLQGVEYFTELKDLSFYKNQISSLDISKNTALKEIYGDCNPLTSLDVSKNTALTYLSVADCQLSSLDVSNNTALDQLYCYHNHLTALNILNNPLLRTLLCNGNSISSLNLSGCPNLLHAFLEGEVSIISESDETYQNYEYYSEGDGAYNLDIDMDTLIDTEAPAAPAITKQPAAQTVAVGKTATFTITASGSDLSYHWQYKKSDGDWMNVSESGTSATLELTAQATHNGYQYRCIVSNIAGDATSNAVKLTVVSKPTIKTQPAAKTVAVGKTAAFKVTASGTGLKYKWQYKKPGGSWTNVSKNGTSATYKLTTKSTYNSYQYRCIVSNIAGKVTSKAVKLTVVSKPTIKTQPKAASVKAGKTATFSVTASGTGLKYQWQYRKPGGNWTKVAKKGTSATLKVTAKSTQNGWQYRCIISNIAGKVTSKAVKLTVK